jgi:hypothetical protein
MNRKSIYEMAYNKCLKKGIIQQNCDKFLQLDFELKLKKCKTSKCKKFYKSKIRSLKRRKKTASKRKKSSKKSRSRRKSSSSKTSEKN